MPSCRASVGVYHVLEQLGFEMHGEARSPSRKIGIPRQPRSPDREPSWQLHILIGLSIGQCLKVVSGHLLHLELSVGTIGGEVSFRRDKPG